MCFITTCSMSFITTLPNRHKTRSKMMDPRLAETPTYLAHKCIKISPFTYMQLGASFILIKTPNTLTVKVKLTNNRD